MEHDEPEIKLEEVPEKLYHIVPIKKFQNYTDIDGNYDSRNRNDFGGNVPFIHTAPSIEQINKHLSYFHHLSDKRFYLLEIKASDLKDMKVTYNMVEDRIYHHLWDALNKNCYKVFLAEKDENKKLRIIDKIS
ncbi:MAG TPA: hypothetical protein QF753_10040 [Victivallales bacterium]|nr:hypothetical protein [Victivallales bacterium]